MYSVGIVVVYLFVQMACLWGLYRLLKNPSVVDVSWSLGLMISGLIYLALGYLNVRSIVIASLLIAWAFRLAGYLWYTRIRKGHIDKRYTELSANWKISPSLGFFLNFQLQGLLILVISSVFFLIGKSTLTHLTLLDGFAFAMVLTGIFGETLADMQLQAFKKQHPGSVCNVGLWQYSRHPNYFFDWVIWVGFALFGLQSNMGYLSFISPLMLYVIFNYLTGPLTEKSSLQSRGQAYLSYQQQTPKFFPWRKKTD